MRFALLIALVALTGCEYSYKMGKSEPTGRYEVVEYGRTTVLIDTSTGASWRLVTMLTDKNELMSIFWEPMTKFDTESASEAHVAYIQELIDFADKRDSK